MKVFRKWSKYVTVKVRSYNSGAGSSKAKIADLDGFVEDGTQVILCQEMGDREQEVYAFLAKHPTWAALWEPKTNAGRKTVILYDTALGGLAWWEALVVLVRGQWLGRKGAGPDTTEAKRLNQFRIRLQNGVRVKFLNNHMTASAFSTVGEEHQNRLRVWKEQAQAFFVAAFNTFCVVIGGGDFNAGKKNKYLQDAIDENCPEWVWDSNGPTHRQQEIDLLGHKRDDRVVVLAFGVTETDGSRNHEDHRSPWVLYGIRRPIRFKRNRGK